MHPSVTQLWREFAGSANAPSGLAHAPESVFHFCDTQAEAEVCAELARLGRKRATAPSLWGFQARGEPLPRPGDFHVVTDWDGIASCVIQTTAVAIVPFLDVTAEHAAAEGEGDGSLEEWRATHWAYYQRELAGTGFVPTETMPIVCEQFGVVYPPAVSG